ncbi:MAG: CsbD family protein [Burkholderiales bacterium]|nr:CsbD family protein [Burkholderiales bacterium]
MNSDQVKGAAKKVAGKVQQEAGKLVGSKEQQVKGAAKQVEGSMQKSLGNVREALKERSKH